MPRKLLSPKQGVSPTTRSRYIMLIYLFPWSKVKKVVRIVCINEFKNKNILCKIENNVRMRFLEEFLF